MARRVERAWNEFTAWCAARRLRPLPAHPWTVAAFARWCEPRLRVAQIVVRIRAIARVHLLACHAPPDRHPTVKRTLRIIDLRQNARRDGSTLFRDQDFVRVTGPSSKRRPVDRAKSEPAKRGRRTLRAQPRLVSRRPPGGRGKP